MIKNMTNIEKSDKRLNLLFMVKQISILLLKPMQEN